MAKYHIQPVVLQGTEAVALTPLNASPREWITCVLADFDAFLQDHASAEKKASGMALSMVSHYPDKPALVRAMVDLAVEELNHYKEVMRLLMAKQITPAADRKDPYVTRLNKLLLDRLLIGAIVERRGAERFALIAKHVADPELQKFYAAIAKSEERHWHLFVQLATDLCGHLSVNCRFCELADLENALVADLPVRPALH
jgi:tRNA-(ms[2]io[6]A)-hydroxylase